MDILSPSSWATTVVGLVLLALAAAAVFRVPGIGNGWHAMLYFFPSWVGAGLATHFFVVTLAILAVLGATRNFELSLGIIAMCASLPLWVVCLRRSARAKDLCQEALQNALGSGFLNDIEADRHALLRERTGILDWIRPFALRRSDVERLKDISYGEAGQRNLLDIYRAAGGPHAGLPVLLQIHGGGWMVGTKNGQGLPLMMHMAARGWICVAVNYQLSPAARMPTHLIDIKRSITWIRKHIAEYGGDPSVIVVTGGSAGGHLASLTALTANQPEWQPGFEGCDTSVTASIPMYGMYDFRDRNHLTGGDARIEVLGKYVMPKDAGNALWDRMSPLMNVNHEAPPMLIFSASQDVLIPVEEARLFEQAMRSGSVQPVGYVEMQGAQHGFDLCHTPWTAHAIDAIQTFAEVCRTRQKRTQPKSSS